MLGNVKFLSVRLELNELYSQNHKDNHSLSKHLLSTLSIRVLLCYRLYNSYMHALKDLTLLLERQTHKIITDIQYDIIVNFYFKYNGITKKAVANTCQPGERFTIKGHLN